MLASFQTQFSVYSSVRSIFILYSKDAASKPKNNILQNKKYIYGDSLARKTRQKLQSFFLCFGSDVFVLYLFVKSRLCSTWSGGASSKSMGTGRGTSTSPVSLPFSLFFSSFFSFFPFFSSCFTKIGRTVWIPAFGWPSLHTVDLSWYIHNPGIIYLSINHDCQTTRIRTK